VGGYLSNLIWGPRHDSGEDHPQRLGTNDNPSQHHRTLGRDNEPTWKTRAILTLLLFTFSWRQREPLTRYLHCLQKCKPQVPGLPDPSPPPSTASNIPRSSPAGHDQPGYSECILYV
jgi:hypothetical protein